MSETMIGKLQRPLFSSDPDVPWLLYNEDRTIQFEIPDRFIPRRVKRAMQNDNKAFWKFHFNGDAVDFIKRTKDRAW